MIIPYFPIVLAALLGWLVGMVINALADSLPIRGALALPFCWSCGSRRPVWNWLIPGRCKNCGAAPRPRTWITAGAFTAAGAWLWWNPPAGIGPWLGLAGLAYFGLVTIIDLEHRLILHRVSAAGAVLGLAIGWLRAGAAAALLGGLAALVLMGVIFLFGELFARLLSRLRGRTIDETVFGFGDVMLGGTIGLMTGWPEVLPALFIAILAAGLFSLVFLAGMLLARRYRLGAAFPYAPFLVLGAIVMIYF